MAAFRLVTAYLLCSSFAALFSYVCLAEKYVPVPVEIPSEGTFRIFTDEDIAKYDGSDPEQPVYMGVKGVVFDVTSGSDFYGKDGPYNSLAGKDCSRAVAKMSLDPADMTKDISDLPDVALKSLDDVWAGTYMEKYPVVGYMDYIAKDNDLQVDEDKQRVDL